MLTMANCGTTPVQFLLRRDTTENWTASNTVLAMGEPSVATDTGQMKIGNGSDFWSALPYVGNPSGSSFTGSTGPTGSSFTGPTGPTGSSFTGPTGVTGSTGPTGSSFTGPTGITGPAYSIVGSTTLGSILTATGTSRDVYGNSNATISIGGNISNVSTTSNTIGGVTLSNSYLTVGSASAGSTTAGSVNVTDGYFMNGYPAPYQTAQTFMVAAGDVGGAANSMMWSTDGKTWNASSNNTFSVRGFGVAWNGSLWVAAGNANNTAAGSMMWSTDGKTWNASGSSFSGYGKAVAWNGSLWVAAGFGAGTAATSMMWSPDGKTWSNSTGNAFSAQGNAVAWNGSLWVAAGQGSGAATSMMWSTDGKTWNASTGSSFNSYGNGVAWNGSLWVAAGYGNGTAVTSMMWSTDGKTWNASSNSTFSSYGTAVAWNGSLWVAAGSGSSSMMWSTDGKTWNASTGSSFANYGYGVAWNGSLWVAAGFGAGTAAYSMMWSPDGKTWSYSTNNSFSVYGYAVASAIPLTAYASGGGGLQIVGGSSNLPTNVTGSLYNASGFSTTLTSVTGTATSNVVQDATVYSFTSGTGGFTVPTGGVIVDYLVVGGGGGGGNGAGGGGGAGGLVYAKGVQLPAGSYAWTVGGGGASQATNNTSGTAGSNSTLSNSTFGNMVALGGGAGGGYTTSPAGGAGASGGGAAGGATVGGNAGGSSATGQGFGGGTATSNGTFGGGGGGAGGSGIAGAGTGGTGGPGLVIPITGSNVYYAGGGGASTNVGAGTSPAGGLGGGGAGTNGAASVAGTSGLANSGGGGGASGNGGASGAGGSGIVIIRVYTNTGSRMLIGDGSGYLTTFSAQSNAVTTDVMTITDQGNVSIGLSNALFNGPICCAFDSIGSMYITDYFNNRIRKVAPTGIVTTFLGNGQGTVTAGTGTGASITSPISVAIGVMGGTEVLFAANNSSIIAAPVATGVMTILAGSTSTGSNDATGTSATFNNLAALALDTANSYVFVADTNNSSIRRITYPGAVVTTLSSTGFSANPGTKATFSGSGKPIGLVFDGTSTFYYVASNGYGKVTTSGTNTALVTSGLTYAYGIAFNSNKTGVYITDITSNVVYSAPLVAGSATVIAGSFGVAGAVDATGTAATFNNLRFPVIDVSGSNLYLPDLNNNKIRKLNLATCNVTTYAGGGASGFASGFVDGSVPTTTVVNNSLVTPATHYPYELYFSNLVGYGQIKLNQGLENGMFFYDCYPNAAGSTQNGWYLANSGNAIAQATSGGKGISLVRINSGNVAGINGVPIGWYMLSNGYVGINCNAPARTLDVAGTGIISSNVAAGASLEMLSLRNLSNVDNGILRLGFNAAAGVLASVDGIVNATANTGALSFKTYSGSVYAEGLYIGSNQRVGINCNAPQVSLDVKGSVCANAQGSVSVTSYGPGVDTLCVRSSTAAGVGAYSSIFFGNSNATNFPYGRIACVDGYVTDYLSSMVFHTCAGAANPTQMPERMRIHTNGFVGINCNAPSYTLDVKGTVRGSNIVGTGTNTAFPITAVSPLCAMNGGPSSGVYPQIEFQFYNAGFNHYIGSRHNGTVGNVYTNSIDFFLYNGGGTQGASTTPGTGNINAMSVTAAGIGVFNSAPSYTLDVTGTIRTTAGLVFGVQAV